MYGRRRLCAGRRREGTWLARGHETARCRALGLLGNFLSRQCLPACFRHEPRRGLDGAGRAARLLLGRAGLGNLHRLRIARHPRLLSERLGAGAAVSQWAADRLEEGLALAPTLAVLKPAT